MEKITKEKIMEEIKDAQRCGNPPLVGLAVAVELIFKELMEREKIEPSMSKLVAEIKRLKSNLETSFQLANKHLDDVDLKSACAELSVSNIEARNEVNKLLQFAESNPSKPDRCGAYKNNPYYPFEDEAQWLDYENKLIGLICKRIKE